MTAGSLSPYFTEARLFEHGHKAHVPIARRVRFDGVRFHYSCTVFASVPQRGTKKSLGNACSTQPTQDEEACNGPDAVIRRPLAYQASKGCARSNGAPRDRLVPHIAQQPNGCSCSNTTLPTMLRLFREETAGDSSTPSERNSSHSTFSKPVRPPFEQSCLSSAPMVSSGHLDDGRILRSSNDYRLTFQSSCRDCIRYHRSNCSQPAQRYLRNTISQCWGRRSPPRPH